MTLVPARGIDQRLDQDFPENRSTPRLGEQLDLQDTGTDVDCVQRNQLAFKDIPILTGSSAKTCRKWPSLEDTIVRTSQRKDGGFLKHDVMSFPDEKCKNPTPGRLHLEVVTEGDKKPRPELPSKADMTISDASLPKTQIQEEKLRERSRKGRERSLRTRRRNVARLKLLEENCVHLSRENEILRDLARSLAGQDDENTAKLFNEYMLVRSEKPEPHKLMHPESYYMNLFPPFSGKASANVEDAHSNTLNILESVLTSEQSLTSQPGRSANSIFGGNHDCAQQGVIASTSKASSQVNLAGSKHDEIGYISSINDSVFADPAYGEGKQIAFSLEEVCSQPLLSAEEIVDLVEQGARAADLPPL